MSHVMRHLLKADNSSHSPLHKVAKKNTVSHRSVSATKEIHACHPSDVWIFRWQLYLVLSIVALLIAAALYYSSSQKRKKRAKATKSAATSKDAECHSYVDEEQPKTLANTRPRETPPTRLHHLDFTRVVLVGGVVIYHVAERVAQVYGNRELQLGVKSQREYDLYTDAVKRWFILGWAFFPCLFYVAGRASAISQESRILMIIKRSLRYIPHLIVGWVVLVIPVAYLSLQYKKKTNVDFFVWLSNKDGYLVADLKYTGLGWLWYIPVHMIIEVLQAPLQCTLKGSFNMYIMLAIGIVSSILGASLINYAVAMVGVAWTCITLAYIVHKKYPGTVPMTPTCMVIIVVISLIAVNLRTDVSPTLRVIKLQSCTFFMFMHSLGLVHGVFPDVSIINGWVILPCAIVGAFTTGFSFPGVQEPRVQTQFPPYKPAQAFHATRFVMLSWICLYVVVSLFQNSAAVRKGHPIFKSAMTLYLLHWFFLEVYLDLGFVHSLCSARAEYTLAAMVCLTFAACWAVHFSIFPTEVLKDKNLLDWVEEEKFSKDKEGEMDGEDELRPSRMDSQPLMQTV